MELTKFWADNKNLIIKTAIAVVVALLLIKFFDFIFIGSILVAIGVAAVVTWNHLSKKHGGIDGVWKAFLKQFGAE